ncbi:MAG: hypothetical protein ACO1N0_02755 [Fluviicola sp.]
MKTKTPIKVLTIGLFISLIFGFVLYKGGYLFFGEKTATVSKGKITSEIRVVSEEDYDVNPFGDLKTEGGFIPENFGKMYSAPPDPRFFSLLSSSKSIVADFDPFLIKEPLEFELKEQFKSKPSKN